MTFHNDDKGDRKEVDRNVQQTSIPKTEKIAPSQTIQIEDSKQDDSDEVSILETVSAKEWLRLNENLFARKSWQGIKVFHCQDNTAKCSDIALPLLNTIGLASDGQIILVAITDTHISEWAQEADSLKLIREMKLDFQILYDNKIHRISEFPGKDKGRYIAETEYDSEQSYELYLFDMHAQKQLKLTFNENVTKFYILRDNLIGLCMDNGLLLMEVDFDPKKGPLVKPYAKQPALAIPNLHRLFIANNYWLAFSASPSLEHPVEPSLYLVDFRMGQFYLQKMESMLFKNLPLIYQIDAINQQYFLIVTFKMDTYILFPDLQFAFQLDIALPSMQTFDLLTREYQMTVIEEDKQMFTYDLPNPQFIATLRKAFHELQTEKKVSNLPAGILDIIAEFYQIQPERFSQLLQSPSTLYSAKEKKLIEPLDSHISSFLLNVLEELIEFLKIKMNLVLSQPENLAKEVIEQAKDFKAFLNLDAKFSLSRFVTSTPAPLRPLSPENVEKLKLVIEALQNFQKNCLAQLSLEKKDDYKKIVDTAFTENLQTVKPLVMNIIRAVEEVAKRNEKELMRKIKK